MDELGVTAKGWTARVAPEVAWLAESNGVVASGPAAGRPSLDTDRKAADAVLALSGTTNGRVADEGFRWLEERVGKPLRPLVEHDRASPWVRGVLLLHPDPSLMHDVPLPYRLHALAAMALFALWPFSRLVHAFSAPLRYLVRPYIVYRSRDDRLAARRAPRGWEQR